jgi:acetyl-CoA carboxylase biotin carboxylase subunit
VKQKVLVANRGEIAVRIIRACRELGLGTVAVFSECDRSALHVRLADEAHPIGPSPAVESYLRIDALLDVAARSGASIVHPGYGFLAENAAFSQACVDAGLRFAGPRPAAMALMGSKTAAREAAVSAGVPVVRGTARPFDAGAPDEEIALAAQAIGFPLLVKAVAGGGGKGMRTVATERELAPAIRTARSEARAAFGDASVYLEQKIASPRHIEIQLLADEHGTVLPFVERECSIQRRHQKVVEESPSPVLDAETRAAMAECAARVARHVGYTSAGTIEFLFDGTVSPARWYFLEMNTRLQVEHPVTEMVTGIDLVTWQLRIAMGERLTVSADQALTPRGHGIECRVYAEDPDRGFLPSPGLVRSLQVPAGPGVRDDGGVAAGFEIPSFYDSMISKLVVWGATRDAAIDRLRRALGEYRVVGVSTTLPFFRWLVEQPAFRSGDFDTTYLDRVLAARNGDPFVTPSPQEESDTAIVAALAEWRRSRRGGTQIVEARGQWRRAARLDGVQ